jgi:branched-chain amino acid transport system ATP-binding protein
MNLLEIDTLEAGYDDALVLRGVSLNADAHEIVAVIGPNGAGKSTMLKAVYSLVTRRSGSVRFDGEDVTGMRPDRLTRRGLNYVPQTDNVFPTLTLEENLHVSALVLSKGERRAALARIRELFPIVAERPRQRAGTLSGGERKLVALARALVTRPKLLLLDEPSAGLSPLAMDAVFQKLVEINALGIGIVMVEQNARRALALAHRGYVLETGRNAIQGTGADLLRDPQVAALYLGGSGTTASSSNSTSAPSGMKPETK